MSAQLFEKLRQRFPRLGHDVDDDVERIIHEAAGVVALALDRGAAHLHAPSQFPLPISEGAVERAVVAHLQRLPAEDRAAITRVAATRLAAPMSATVAYYGSAGSLDIQSAKDLVAQALLRPLPVDLVPIAARAKAKLAAQAERRSAVRDAHGRAARAVTRSGAGAAVARSGAFVPGAVVPGAAAAAAAAAGGVAPRPGLSPSLSLDGLADILVDERRIVARQVEMRVVSAECIDSAEAGRDEMAFGAVLQDLLRRDSQVVSAPTDLGRFKRTETKALDELVHTFELLPNMRFDHTLTGSLFLAERDPAGGFGRFLEKTGTLGNSELNEVAFLAIATLVGAVAGLVDGAVIFGAIGLGLGPVACVALGLAGGLLGTVLGAMELALVGVAAIVLYDSVVGLLRDDLFERKAVAITVGADGLIRESGAETFRQDLFFDRKGARNITARYRITLEWRVKRGLSSGAPEEPEDVGPPTIAADEARALRNLASVDHVVVLMLENRSFDHMLGYLGLTGRADGVTEGMSNPGPDDDAEDVAVFPLEDTRFLIDPGHSFCAVRLQMDISDTRCGSTEVEPGKEEILATDPQPLMTGFVRHFGRVVNRVHNEASHKDGELRHPEHAVNQVKPDDIMGYYTADQVPVFDQLAREFAVCDRWYSSFPGNTWVNRTIAFTGRPARDGDAFVTSNHMPKFEKSLFRDLPDDVSWSFYSQDVPTLLAVDSALALAHTRNLRKLDEFIEAAADGTLPNVSWIDPNFIDVGHLDDWERFGGSNWFPTTCNDDHPPADIAQGQILVAQVFAALFNSPQWERTLLVVLYDEHGGFHDHRPPPRVAEAAQLEEADPHFTLLGARVPALVVSPRVGRGLAVSHFADQRQLSFDHASLMKTIFTRFSPDTPLPPRVAAAEHLGWLLNEDEARFPVSAPSPRTNAAGVRPTAMRPRARAAKQHRRALLERMTSHLGALLSQRSLVNEPERPLTELQEQMLETRRELLAAVPERRSPWRR